MGRGTHFAGPVFSGGVPLMGPGIPATFGRVYFVDADNGSDSNSGLSMDEAFASIQKALNTVRTNKHDIIVLSAVGSHVPDDELVVSKNRVHIIGLDPAMGRYMGQRAKISLGVTTGSAIAAIKVTGVGCSFHNLKIRSEDTLSTSLYAVADGGEFTVWDNCWFEKATDLDQTGAAELLCNADTGFYRHCTIGNCIYTTSVARQNVLFTRETISGKVARDVIFEDCLFQNRTSATTFVNLRATANDIERVALFRGCVFWSAKTSSATQAAVAGVASALTDAEILLHNCAVQNITDVAAGSKGVFTTSPTPSATGTESVEVTTS